MTREEFELRQAGLWTSCPIVVTATWDTDSGFGWTCEMAEGHDEAAWLARLYHESGADGITYTLVPF